MCLPNFMEFHHCLFKILKNQNIADGQTNRTDKQRYIIMGIVGFLSEPVGQTLSYHRLGM